MMLKYEQKNCAEFKMELFLTIVDNCQAFTTGNNTCILYMPNLNTNLTTKSKQVRNKDTAQFYKENG